MSLKAIYKKKRRIFFFYNSDNFNSNWGKPNSAFVNQKSPRQIVSKVIFKSTNIDRAAEIYFEV